jgi:hypothetical protein
MTHYIKYKDVIYFHCFGTNDENFASNKGRYSSNGAANNAKIFRFNLGSDLYNLNLSKNSKFQLIYLTTPLYAATAYQIGILRLRTTTECKIWDSYKKTTGYPIINKVYSSAINPIDYSPNIEHFISINQNFLKAGYIEFEFEFPGVGTDIDFTDVNNKPFYIHFKIVDVEDEETQDRNIAPFVQNDSTINYAHNNGNCIPMLRDRPIK